MATRPGSCTRCGARASFTGDAEDQFGAVCGQCGGRFLGEAPSRTLFQDILRLTPEAIRQISASFGGRSVKCPGCKGTMALMPIRSVQIDHCLGCGCSWLDHGELTRLTGGAVSLEAGKPAPTLPAPTRSDAPRASNRVLAVMGPLLFPAEPAPSTWRDFLYRPETVVGVAFFCMVMIIGVLPDFYAAFRFAVRARAYQASVGGCTEGSYRTSGKGAHTVRYRVLALDLSGVSARLRQLDQSCTGAPANGSAMEVWVAHLDGAMDVRDRPRDPLGVLLTYLLLTLAVAGFSVIGIGIMARKAR